VSQRGLEMPDRRRLLFGVSVAVEERQVARRENLFGVVFAEIGHRVGITDCGARRIRMVRAPVLFLDGGRLQGTIL